MCKFWRKSSVSSVVHRKTKQLIQLILCQMDVGGWLKEKGTRVTDVIKKRAWRKLYHAVKRWRQRKKNEEQKEAGGNRTINIAGKSVNKQYAICIVLFLPLLSPLLFLFCFVLFLDAIYLLRHTTYVTPFSLLRQSLSCPFSSARLAHPTDTREVELTVCFSIFMLYVAWKRGLPRKFARFILIRPIKRRSFNLLCVLHLFLKNAGSQVCFRLIRYTSQFDRLLSGRYGQNNFQLGLSTSLNLILVRRCKAERETTTSNWVLRPP